MKSNKQIHLDILVNQARNYHIDRGFPIRETFNGIQTMIDTYLEDKGLPKSVAGIEYQDEPKKEHTESYQLKRIADKVDTFQSMLPGLAKIGDVVEVEGQMYEVVNYRDSLWDDIVGRRQLELKPLDING